MKWFFIFFFYSYALAFESIVLNKISPCTRQVHDLNSLHCPLLKSAMNEESPSVFMRPSIYKNVFISGASVSAGYGLTPRIGPSERFLQEIGTVKDVKNVAVSGSSSRQSLKKLYESENFAEASVVIAVDLFFWDSVRNSDCSEEAITKKYGADFYQKLFEKKAILAKIPVLKMDQKPQCVEEINKLLVRRCKLPNCHLLDGEKLFNHGHDHLMQPDGLHPTADGNKILSDEMCRSIVSHAAKTDEKLDSF